MRQRDRFGAWGLDSPRGETWRERAVCKYVEDPDIFFPAFDDMRGGAGAERRAYAKPRQVCARCPVWRQCRAYAIERGERYGMWGGLTPRQIRREHEGRAAERGGMDEYDRRGRDLATERLRPDRKPPTRGELLTGLITALHRLYSTPPDGRGE
ncbi:hypothetical protein FHS43_006219 [Streptosporangium becharense]|uniref:Transcriptional regulator WhiB n=1 Tax=Streptosporangium becharense TaxID=1816182 RepID=A0A7W9IGI3_9ACTN|nr:WhiB family transcriptional regulator [Streptosporangium becharense]MBB2914907.1 hypothetical protein [Streptosporangium becharense]MBB5820282.1 hypothetical protein [Streptosporangium becharense]